MDEITAKVSPEDDNAVVPESPKPLAFTIEFESPKAVDSQKHKNLLEKFQNRHRRGQSMSKLEETLPVTPTAKKHPHTGNLPRKSSFQSEGYFSSDEKSEKVKNVRTASLKLKSELTLPLKHLTTDKMTQSFPNRSFNLPSIESPEVELKDVSSPEDLELISPISPAVCVVKCEEKVFLPSAKNNNRNNKKVVRQYSSPECESEMRFIDGTEFDFDNSDTVSDAGTYTLDADNYTEEQKARMSIDNDFKLEQVSFMKKSEEYIRSLNTLKKGAKQQNKQKTAGKAVQPKVEVSETTVTVREEVKQQKQQLMKSSEKEQEHLMMKSVNGTDEYKQKQKRLSAPVNVEVIETTTAAAAATNDNETINVNVVLKNRNRRNRAPTNIDTALKQLSLSQKTTVTDEQPKQMNNGEGDLNDVVNKTFTKIMFPSSKARMGGGGGGGGGGGASKETSAMDQGCFTSVTSSGVFSRRPTTLKHVRKSSLVHSEIHVEAYTDDSEQNGGGGGGGCAAQEADMLKNCDDLERGFDKMALERVTNLPPAVGGYCGGGTIGGGKMSPSKIPSPMHSLTRPRSRSSMSNGGVDMLSDSSLDLDTESYLKPTQNYIQSLQTRLSLDSDSDCDIKLNNDTRNLLKQKLKHVRHNSFDDRNVTVSNKLEHFQTKNLQHHHNIDQTYAVTGAKNQFYTQKAVHRIQNSPNDSPVKRSSSFSTKNQLDQAKSVNILQQKELNLRNSPHLIGSAVPRCGPHIQRSSSTANIKPNVILRRSSVNSDNHDNVKVKERPRSYAAETESSSEDDFMDHKNFAQNTKNVKKTAAAAAAAAAAAPTTAISSAGGGGGCASDLTTTRYNRAFSLRRGRLDGDAPTTCAAAAAPASVPKCPNTPEMKRKFLPPTAEQHRGVSVDRKAKSADVQSRYLNLGAKSNAVAAAVAKTAAAAQQHIAAPRSAPPGGRTPAGAALKNQVFSRTDSGRFSMKSTTKPPTASQKHTSGPRKDGHGQGKSSKSGRSNSSLSSREVEFQNWKRRKSYDPMKAAAEGKKKAEIARKQHVMVQSYNEAMSSQHHQHQQDEDDDDQEQDYDSSPSHSANSSSVHRSQSFHGTAALDQLASSEEDDDDLTLSDGGGGFSPPTPSPCDMSPARTRQAAAPWRRQH